MLSPVFSPGPTTSGFLPVMVRSAVFITLVSGGTTEEMIQSSTSQGFTSNRARMFLISSPYWSEVLMRSVAILASNWMASPWMPPITILVLPISMAISMICSPQRGGPPFFL